MTTAGDENDTLLAEYTVAVTAERAAWRLLNDPNLSAVERVKAYARWRAAADLTKELAIKLRNPPV